MRPTQERKREMANIKINYTERQIEVTASYLKKASVFGTEEFKELKQVRESEPEFKVVAKHAKKNCKKNTYSNLTFEAMEAHIKKFETDEEVREARLNEFLQVRKYAVARKAEYPLTKKWFLSNYKETYNNFVASSNKSEELETEIA